MLVVQHNCGQSYENTIMAIETAWSIGAGIVMLPDPFIGIREISHSAFNLYWPQAERKEIKVMTAVQKELTDKIVLQNRTDLVNHPYVMLLEIRELDPRSKKSGRKTRVVNVYNNRVGRVCRWDSGISCTRRALEDIKEELVIPGRVLIDGDINAHSAVRNLHCDRRQNATVLEDLIERFGLPIINELGRATRSLSHTISIIDLALSKIELGLLTLWEFPEEYPVLSDHELINFCWEHIDLNSSKFGIGRITGWDIQNFIENKDQLKMAKAEWKLQTQVQPILQNLCRKEDLDQEVEWIESTLNEILNKNCKLVRVRSYFKRWLNKEVETACRSWAKEKRAWGKIIPDRENFKQAQNPFYRIVRKAKRECWQKFQEGEEEISDPSNVSPEDKNRC